MTPRVRPGSSCCLHTSSSAVAFALRVHSQPSLIQDFEDYSERSWARYAYRRLPGRPSGRKGSRADRQEGRSAQRANIASRSGNPTPECLVRGYEGKLDPVQVEEKPLRLPEGRQGYTNPARFLEDNPLRVGARRELVVDANQSSLCPRSRRNRSHHQSVFRTRGAIGAAANFRWEIWRSRGLPVGKI